ncbi:hypothetical protein [uncultured Psychroserpens sp.]|uniref:hypothetical protein n=1 Tax=uncultured Psychroserpens sp. TaxID=255436 RepID=UPI002603FC71|nr:hypothetical protein [uncultured Psychroserpens sp.]
MELLLFQTNIETTQKVKLLSPILNNHSEVLKWNVDTEDIDNVLRIEATKNLKEDDVMELVRILGFDISILSD